MTDIVRPRRWSAALQRPLKLVMSQACSPTSTRLLAFVGTILTIGALLWSPTVPRFNYGPLNYIFSIFLAAMLPATLWLLMLVIRSLWLRWIVGIASLLVFLPAALFSFVALIQLTTGVTAGRDTSFEQTQEIKGEHGTFRLYRTNGGAMTSFGLVLRRERQLLPGIKIVTIVRSFYPAAEASLDLISSVHARLVVAPYGTETVGETFEFST